MCSCQNGKDKSGYIPRPLSFQLIQRAEKYLNNVRGMHNKIQNVKKKKAIV